MKTKKEHENIKKILPTTIFQSSALVNLNLVGTVSAVISGPNFSIKALTGISPAWPHQHLMLKRLFLIAASLVICSHFVLIGRIAMAKVDKSKMKCNKPRRTPDGPKKFVVKACEGSKKKIIRYGDISMRIKKSNPGCRKSVATI